MIRRSFGLALAALVLAACGRTSTRHRIDFAHLSFDLPGDWTHHEATRRGVDTAICTPTENDRKESVTVIRSELAPLTARAGGGTLSQLLETAQADLPGVRVSKVTSIKTDSGLSGARIEADFIPPGQTEHYYRVHVVLVDGSSLVHVLYTARSADPDVGTLNAVLATIRDEEG